MQTAEQFNDAHPGFTHGAADSRFEQGKEVLCNTLRGECPAKESRMEHLQNDWRAGL